MTNYVELKDRGQADPNMVESYLDTADPEFSWLHTASHKNVNSGEVSPREIHSFHIAVNFGIF